MAVIDAIEIPHSSQRPRLMCYLFWQADDDAFATQEKAEPMSASTRKQ
jgi:hypothetical protein